MKKTLLALALVLGCRQPIAPPLDAGDGGPCGPGGVDCGNGACCPAGWPVCGTGDAVGQCLLTGPVGGQQHKPVKQRSSLP